MSFWQYQNDGVLGAVMSISGVDKRTKIRELKEIANAVGLEPNRSWRHPLREGYSGNGIDAKIESGVRTFIVRDASGDRFGGHSTYTVEPFVSMNISGPADSVDVQLAIDLLGKWYDVHDPSNYVQKKRRELETQ